MAHSVPTYDVFGFMHGEDEHKDMRRPAIPAWRLHDIVDYFTSRGFDGILIQPCGSIRVTDPPDPHDVR